MGRVGVGVVVGIERPLKRSGRRRDVAPILEGHAEFVQRKPEVRAAVAVERAAQQQRSFERGGGRRMAVKLSVDGSELLQRRSQRVPMLSTQSLIEGDGAPQRVLRRRGVERAERAPAPVERVGEVVSERLLLLVALNHRLELAERAGAVAGQDERRGEMYLRAGAPGVRRPKDGLRERERLAPVLGRVRVTALRACDVCTYGKRSAKQTLSARPGDLDGAGEVRVRATAVAEPLTRVPELQEDFNVVGDDR